MNPGEFQTTDHYLNLDDPIAAYRGNPLIGALGPVLDAEERVQLLARPVVFDELARSLPPHLLPHQMASIGEIFIPGIEHDRAVEQAHLVIRQSYTHRNPLSAKANRQRAILTKEMNRSVVVGKDSKLKRKLPWFYERVPLLGMLVAGTIGTGKTTVISAMAESLQEQVVDHAYCVNGVAIAFTQVVYLRMTMVHNASLKAFAAEFFKALSEVLGDDELHEAYGVFGVSESSGLITVCRAILEYRIGLIMVDDSQNMRYHSRGSSAVLSYLVNMINTTGVAVMVVGTDDTRDMLAADATFGRRFLGSTPEFRAMRPKKPGDKDDGFFEFYLQQLFVHQYTKCRAEPDELMANLIYEITGGVPDLVNKLFVLAQCLCIARGGERIDEKILRITSEELFSVVSDRVEEIKGCATAQEKIQDEKRKLHMHYLSLTAEWLKNRGADLPIAPSLPPAGSDVPPTTNAPAPVVVLPAPLPAVEAKSRKVSALDLVVGDAFASLK